MFGKVVRSLCRDRRGLSFIAGAIGILAGVEHLLSAHALTVVCGRPATSVIEKPAPARTKARLKITQTRSELGYVYWVLREFGANPRYSLFDTWQEAMDEANRRINAAAEVQADSVLVPA